MIKILRIEETDNVAVLLTPVEAGQECEVAGIRVKASQAIPFAHKIALMDILAGENVIKYGEIIGYATQDIKAGDWIHTHNIDTDRGRLKKRGGE